MREQEATLANLDASTQLQAAIIDQARAKTGSTAAERQRAEADGRRARSLVRRNVVSEQDFEQVDQRLPRPARMTMRPGPPSLRRSVNLP